MASGHLIIALHAHLPWVRHHEHDFFLEENWLYEACLDCYVPLVRMLRRLREDSVKSSLALSISPTLLEMLADELLMSRLRRHTERLIALSETEASRTRKKDPASSAVARMYAERYTDTLAALDTELSGSIVESIRELGTSSHLELMTTSATHAFLPNLMQVPEAMRAQIEGGMRIFERHMGFRPKGFWLPECGYTEGLDALVTACGGEYFFLETHGLLHATPRLKYGIHRPVFCPSGAAAFGRDPFAAERVWSAKVGYPADPVYRDFFSDLGHESRLPHIEEHISPFVMRGQSAFTGLKFKRITGPDNHKETYHPEEAVKRAHEHADDFIAAIDSHASLIKERYGFTPAIAAPYDAELFGHWWFEGIEWLEAVLRKASHGNVDCLSPSQYLSAYSRRFESATPSMSSWGEGGYASTWTEGEAAEWAAKLLRASMQMASIAGVPVNATRRGLLDQAARELMLAQSSDWAFMSAKGSHKDYARARQQGHLEAFNSLMRAYEGQDTKQDRERLHRVSPALRDIKAELFVVKGRAR